MPLPFPSPEMRKRVGGPEAEVDFEKAGKTLYDKMMPLLGDYLGQAFLDFGCGCGRLARTIAREYQRPSLSYFGFDADVAAATWCHDNLTPKLPRFHFSWEDVKNSAYNPGGKVEPLAVRLPYPDNFITSGVAYSLFTHISDPAHVIHYLGELRRVLAPGAKFMATWFLNYPDKEIARAGAFPFRLHMEPVWIQVENNPDAAVCQAMNWVVGVATNLGLSICRFAPGGWGFDPQTKKLIHGQDALVLQKAE